MGRMFCFVLVALLVFMAGVVPRTATAAYTQTSAMQACQNQLKNNNSGAWKDAYCKDHYNPPNDCQIWFWSDQNGSFLYNWVYDCAGAITPSGKCQARPSYATTSQGNLTLCKAG
jgi:hypothetical protein